MCNISSITGLTEKTIYKVVAKTSWFTTELLGEFSKLPVKTGAVEPIDHYMKDDLGNVRLNGGFQPACYNKNMVGRICGFENFKDALKLAMNYSDNSILRLPHGKLRDDARITKIVLEPLPNRPIMSGSSEGIDTGLFNGSEPVFAGPYVRSIDIVKNKEIRAEYERYREKLKSEEQKGYDSIH